MHIKYGLIKRFEKAFPKDAGCLNRHCPYEKLKWLWVSDVGEQ